MLDLITVFTENKKEYCAFEEIEDPPSQCRDLCALIMLDKLVPGKVRIISGTADNYEFFISIKPSELAAAASEQDIVDLIRCGVMFRPELDLLMMYT